MGDVDVAVFLKVRGVGGSTAADFGARTGWLRRLEGSDGPFFSHPPSFFSPRLVGPLRRGGRASSYPCRTNAGEQ